MAGLRSNFGSSPQTGTTTSVCEDREAETAEELQVAIFDVMADKPLDKLKAGDKDKIMEAVQQTKWLRFFLQQGVRNLRSSS